MKRWRPNWRAATPALVLLVLLLVAWQLVATYGRWPSYLFPPPRAVLDSIIGLMATGELSTAMYVTLRRLLIGFVISVVTGSVVAFAMVRFLLVRRAVKPYLLGFQSLPSIAWVPLSLLWFGYSENAMIFITVIGSIFAVTIAFTDALMGVRPAHLLAARNMGSKGVGLITRVMIPAALPPLVSGAKQAWSFAWRSLVGAEIIILLATRSLGFLLNQGRDFSDISQVFAVMLATLALGWLFEVFAFARADVWIRRRYGLAVP